jgi:hypothetical protein
MYKRLFIFAATVVLAGITMLPTVSAAASVMPPDDKDDKNKKDQLVCYQWDIFPGERFKLNIKEHSPLSESKEEKNFDHPKQTAYSVHGKHIVEFAGMSAVDGTVVTAKDAGAHLGLHSIFVRGDGVSEFARPVTVDCTADEDKATPNTWRCESRNEFDVYHGFSMLTKVDETKDPLCSCFQNREFICTSGEDWSQAQARPASVMKQ